MVYEATRENTVHPTRYTMHSERTLVFPSSNAVVPFKNSKMRLQIRKAQLEEMHRQKLE